MKPGSRSRNFPGLPSLLVLAAVFLHAAEQELQEQFIAEQPEFKFCVGDDNSMLCCVFAAGSVDFQTEITDALGHIATDRVAAFFPINIFVVTGFAFRRGREDRLG